MNCPRCDQPLADQNGCTSFRLPSEPECVTPGCANNPHTPPPAATWRGVPCRVLRWLDGGLAAYIVFDKRACPSELYRQVSPAGGPCVFKVVRANSLST